MLRERPVAKDSAALEGTNPNFLAASLTRFLVSDDTDPCPDNAREAVDFDTPAWRATSDKVAMSFSVDGATWSV